VTSEVLVFISRFSTQNKTKYRGRGSRSSFELWARCPDCLPVTSIAHCALHLATLLVKKE